MAQRTKTKNCDLQFRTSRNPRHSSTVSAFLVATPSRRGTRPGHRVGQQCTQDSFLYFSLLPAYRGAAPAQRALHNGETGSGVTVFQLDKGMDTGPIFAQESISIDPTWRSFELLQQLANRGPDVVKRSFEMIMGGKPPVEQVGVASNAPKITKSEAKIDFTHDSLSISNAIRAFTYEPGAWTLWKEEPFKISAAKIIEQSSGAPGQVSVIEKSVFVATGKGALELLRVIPSGKKEMDAIEWARGARLTGGEIFG